MSTLALIYIALYNFLIMLTKPKLKKKVKFLKSPEFTRIDVTFAVRMIQATPITAAQLAAADVRASRARDARSAKFLDRYRVKVAV